MVNTVDSLIKLKVIRPVLVVGIENTERRRDLTGPTTVAKDSTIAPQRRRVGRLSPVRPGRVHAGGEVPLPLHR